MPEQLPLHEQYRRVKAAHADAILFFRLGDFYEMFNSDAIEASALLNLTLTKRQDAPMCGVPHHAAKTYIAKLLKAGRKVAICEQLSPPGRGKGIIERGVVEVLTPGAVVDDDYLVSGENNYIAALGLFGQAVSFAWADASTGEFRAESLSIDDAEALRRELSRVGPRELLVRESSLGDPRISALLAEREGLVLDRYPDWTFSVEQGRAALARHFGVASMRGFGFDDDDPALAGAGAIVEYLRDSAKVDPRQLATLKGSDDAERVILDDSSRRNLELDRNLRDGGKAYTLLGVIDFTKTAMGARELRRRLLRPLRSSTEINARLDAVEALHRDQKSLERVRSSLATCRDLERLASRLATGKAGPRDLVSLRETVKTALKIDDALPAGRAPGLSVCSEPERRDRMTSLVGVLDAALLDEPAFSPADGDVMRAGWDAELDRQRALRADAHAVIEAYLEEEKAATGLAGLRIRYNRIIGYYLELSKASAGSAPPHFIRRQSLSNGERFSTERLAALESDIHGAAERIVELEKASFSGLCERVRPMSGELAGTAAELASLDCSASLAWAATARDYVRPEVDDSLELSIHGGRHPVVEAYLPTGEFVPNDLALDGAGVRFALITGPNMAGKSTYLRQNALIVILAQAGSFVPARSARVGAVDRVFCRVGAQDNLARGESTFLLEMHETAGILNNAGPRSLVVMDEVGRGTGTLDGLSIAWAVSEHVLDACESRALFATHYHELTALRHDRLVDLSMAVDEREGDVIFRKHVVPGPSAGSYGIHVAKLAGVPQAVVERAKGIRATLESGEARLGGIAWEKPDAPADHGTAVGTDIRFAEAGGRRRDDGVAGKRSVRLPDDGFLFSAEELALDELRGLDPDSMTPLEALNRLSALKKALSKKS